MTEFLLPELGEGVTSGDIVTVMVSVGQTIAIDSPILEIETDKAVIEVPSSVAGTITAVFVKVGDVASPGQKILDVAAEEAVAETAETPPSAAGQSETTSAPAPASSPQAIGQAEIIAFMLPELGEGVTSGDVVNVMVSVGDTISVDDPILEIETDKAMIEVPSSVAGTVTEIFTQAGQTAALGQKVLNVMTEVPAVTLADTATPEPPAPTTPPSIESPPVPPLSPSANVVDQPTKANISGILPHTDRPILHELAPAAPSVRRFAREIGIDIRQVPGHGPGGRISIEAVKAFAKALTQETAQTKPAPAEATSGIAAKPLPDFSKFGLIEAEPMSNVRRATATHLSHAWQTIPHVTQFDQADWTDSEKLRKQFSKQVEAAGAKLTPTVIILKVLAAALKKFPAFASSVDIENQQIVYKQYCHIGVAVDTPRGLLVPVIRDVDKKNIIQLSLELGELADKARRGKTTLAEMQGGVITLTNLGGVGGTSFTPIVNWPEVAILGVSRGRVEPIYIDGEFQPRQMMPLSLSYDHRVIDGVAGARFLRWICQALEQPFMLLVDG